jgi:tRNA (mo5U34)-methyltransferase
MTDLREAINQISWYHKMMLPGGLVTPGVSDTARGLPRLRMPERLDGLSVLDIGAWDGFYSFEAKRRGAKRVLATDSFCWSGQPGSGTNDGFLLAREALGLEVEDMYIDVMEIAPERVGYFDVTFLLGVLYHLTDPIIAIRNAASVTNRLLIVETVSGLRWLPRPAGRLFVGSELNNDETNWWGLNSRALRDLLLSSGFKRVEIVFQTPIHRLVGRSFIKKVRNGQSFWQNVRGPRIVLHAFK